MGRKLTRHITLRKLGQSSSDSRAGLITVSEQALTHAKLVRVNDCMVVLLTAKEASVPSAS